MTSQCNRVQKLGAVNRSPDKILKKSSISTNSTIAQTLNINLTLRKTSSGIPQKSLYTLCVCPLDYTERSGKKIRRRGRGRNKKKEEEGIEKEEKKVEEEEEENKEN
ncbi:hypothetical protein M8J77_000136 [Diaphorina citri]|nr:hypothetical protein M8J77_000136 [Diaphorina citri]